MLYQHEAGLETVKIERQDRREYFVTVVPSGASDPVGDQVRDVYARLVERLRKDDARILYERIYADKASWADVLAERTACLARLPGFDGGVPNLLDGGPCKGAGLAGVQVWAVSGPTVRSVTENGRVCGRSFEGREGAYLMLSDVATAPDPNRGAYAERMFEHAAGMLEAEGFAFKTDILRTWIYLEDILDWYDDFNRARSSVFHKCGITSPDGFLPASTGIGFQVAGDGACTMDVLALHPSGGADVTLRRCYNPMQNEAPEYGSAFTRGTELTVDGIRTTLVSGTAAIDEMGRTIHEEDAGKQMIRTVENIQALLEQSGMDWSDMSQGTLFLPSRDLVDVYREVEQQLHLPETPLLEVVGTVCRADLWVEIEVTATAKV